jgi:hypothetical protein
MVNEYCAVGRQCLTECTVFAAVYEPPVATTCVLQSLRRDHVVSSGQLSVVTFTSTYIPLHGVGADVGFDVVGGCEREGGSECFCERIDSPRHNKIEHGYNQQNTYSRIGHIGACPA